MRIFGGVIGFDVERMLGFVIRESETVVSLETGGTGTYDVTVRDEAIKSELDEWLTMELCAADD